MGLRDFESPRRRFIGGGLMVAAAPWITGASAMAECHSMYPRVGYRCLPVGDRVGGIGACYTSAPVREPSANIRAGAVEFSEDLIARLLQVSLLNGDGDPRTVELTSDAERAAGIVSGRETRTMALLRESSLYWIQTNPVFLYAVRGPMSMCLFSFLQGFFSRLGGQTADWLWEQVVER